MSSKPCPQCGRLFSNHKHPFQEFCSRDCWKQTHHADNHETRICAGCGVEFETTKTSDKKYCTAKCAFKHQLRNPIRKQVEHICEWCGVTFSRPQSRQGRFCSNQCRSEFAAHQPKPGARKPEAYITLNCKVCGKQYTVGRFYVEHRRSSYCSDACKYADISQRMQKHGNPNYRGGTVKYRGRNWGRQSRMALKRDGYICQICHKHLGKKGWDYGVHHIRPYREFNGDYEAANQLTNLITLCRSCHTKVEFGKMPCPRPLL